MQIICLRDRVNIQEKTSLYIRFKLRDESDNRFLNYIHLSKGKLLIFKPLKGDL